MVEQGGDGVSWGSLNEVVMAGQPMVNFIPLHLGALERNPVTKNGSSPGQAITLSV